MAKWIYWIGTNNDDPSKDKEFNEWYNTVHMPDLTQRVPDAITGTRYELVKSLPPAKSTPGWPQFGTPPEDKDVPKYLAIYEVESGEIEQGLERFFTQSKQLGAEGRHNPLTIIVNRYAYRQIGKPHEKIST
jgi:hypothetical protein